MSRSCQSQLALVTSDPYNLDASESSVLDVSRFGAGGHVQYPPACFILHSGILNVSMSGTVLSGTSEYVNCCSNSHRDTRGIRACCTPPMHMAVVRNACGWLRAGAPRPSSPGPDPPAMPLGSIDQASTWSLKPATFGHAALMVSWASAHIHGRKSGVRAPQRVALKGRVCR